MVYKWLTGGLGNFIGEGRACCGDSLTRSRHLIEISRIEVGAKPAFALRSSMNRLSASMEICIVRHVCAGAVAMHGWLVDGCAFQRAKDSLRGEIRDPEFASLRPARGRRSSPGSSRSEWSNDRRRNGGLSSRADHLRRRAGGARRHPWATGKPVRSLPLKDVMLV